MTDKPDVIMVDDAVGTGVDDHEKAANVRVVDTFHVLGLSDEDADFYNNYTPAQRARTKRKVRYSKGQMHRDFDLANMLVVQIDIRLTPMLAALYLISHLDRSNIGNTKIEGIDKDLGIAGTQWNIVLSL